MEPFNFYQLLIAILLAGGVSLGAFKFKLLTKSGIVAALLVGTAIMGLGGLYWALPLLTFFITSSLLSRLRKALHGETEESKGAQRDAVQVFSNGGIAAFIAVLGAIFSLELYACFLGAIAAATADTWSTEIGLLWGKNPRSIVSWKSMLPGTSGGVTLVGFEGGLLGAIIIAQVGSFWQADLIKSKIALAVIIAGFCGTLFDSLLGATLQHRLRCVVCSKATEKRLHCQRPTDSVGGWAWLNNDRVNLLNTLIGAGVGGILFECLKNVPIP